MFFTTTYRYNFSIPIDHLKYRLIGSQVKIHNLEFEVLEQDHSLRIIPNTEEVNSSQTFPVTEVELKEDGNKTNVVVTSKLNRVDSGGPIVVALFCLFLLLASIIILYVEKEPVITIIIGTFSLLFFTVFLIRMQMGYFDYVRKIRDYIKLTGDQVTTDVRRQLFKHKLK